VIAISSQPDHNNPATSTTHAAASHGSASRQPATTRKERLLPVFVLEILKAESSKDSHCSQAFIREKLQQEPYGINPNRRTIARCISSLLDEELCIFGDTREFWYDPHGYYPK